MDSEDEDSTGYLGVDGHCQGFIQGLGYRAAFYAVQAEIGLTSLYAEYPAVYIAWFDKD